MTTSLSTARRNAAVDGHAAALNNGFLRVYAGSVPANADAALGGATLLGTLGLGATAFGAAASGTATANPITADSAADATGTASFFRAFASDGTTVVLQGTVTATGGGGVLELNTVAITAGVQIAVTSFTLTRP